MASRVLKQSENSLSLAVPALKSKTGILSTLTNKNARIGDFSMKENKTALERQRENASKLSSGRSVVSVIDKENKGAFKKPLKATPKLSQRSRTLVEEEKNIKKETTNISVYQHDKTKAKEKKILVAPQQDAVIPSVKTDLEEVEPEKRADEEEVIPSNVKIIDADEDISNSEFILGLYAKDIYNFLRYLEEVQSVRKDYLTTSHIMTQHMRTVLVDWIFEVQQVFRLLNETVQLSIALLDRFMQDHPGVVKGELQLVVIACIFLASKYEEMYPPDLDNLVDISANTYTKLQVLRMEKVIFSALDFQMGRPLPAQFLRRYGRAGNVDMNTYCLSKYFIDLSLVNYSLCHVRPSLLAAASLYLSLYLFADETDTDFWTPTLSYYSQYTAETLKPVVSKIATIVLENEKSKFQTVHKKYLDPKRHFSVSARSELMSTKIHKIADECEGSLYCLKF